MKKTKVAAVLLAASMTAGLLAGCGGTETASFPDPEKTITMIVPQAAGGGTDLQARQLVEAMKSV